MPKIRKKPTTNPFPINDGYIELKHLITPYPKRANFFEKLSLRSGGLLGQLNHLESEIRKLQKDGKDLDIVTSETGDKLLMGLRGDIETAKKAVADNKLEDAAWALYSIGLAVGRMNHAEGWYLGLQGAAGLAKGRPLGKKATEENAAKRHKELRNFVIGYFMANPMDTNGMAISAARRSGIKKHTEDKSGKPYKDGTLIKIIVGCKEIALKNLTKN